MKALASRKSQRNAPNSKASSRLAKKRILIVDDHPLVREGLRGTINHHPDLMVCGEAETASSAQEAVERLRPDLALVDISLPGKSGLELIKDLHTLFPNLAILAISMHEETLYAERSLKAGASGYITKHQPAEELIGAIRKVLSGRIHVSERVADGILHRLSNGGPAARTSPLDTLSDRELEILQLIGDGKSPSEIARELHISPKTVAVHNTNLRHKLGIESTTRLIRFAVQCQTLPSP